MKLTKKIILLIAAISALFSILFFVLFRIVLAEPIETQKQVRARQVMSGALAVLDGELKRIRHFCEDWAIWDTMYRYASNPTSVIEKELAPLQTLESTDLSFILVVNKSAKILFSAGYDHFTGKEVSFNRAAREEGPIWDFLVATMATEYSRTTITATEHGPMLLNSSPILRSDDSGPINGRILMGHFADSHLEERIGASIGENTRILPASGEREIGCGVRVVETAHRITIMFPVKDNNGASVLTIRIDVPKRVFDILESAVSLFFLLLIAGFILFGIIFYFMIHRLVVRRVQTISVKTDKIVSFEDLTLRVPVKLRDEITALSGNINKMLQRLQTENLRREEIEHMMSLNEKLVCMGKVSSHIAHEVNNPLFAIANCFERIKKHLPHGNPGLDKTVALVEREVKRVRKITQNMHQLTIRQVEDPSLSDISVIVDAAINVITWSKRAKDTVIDFKNRGQSFPLYCTPDSLQQVFINLIANAVDAMEGRGTVTIEMADEGAAYRVTVTDTGPGFDPDIAESMFDSYQTTKPGTGTGLGLYISKKIITNHGGSITPDHGYRGGARIRVRLPKKGGPPDEPNN